MITTQNIDVVLDHHKYGVRPSGIVFYATQAPQHGRIAVDLSLRSSQYANYVEDGKTKQSFTLLDLSRDKVGILYTTFIQGITRAVGSRWTSWHI